jgi:V8-like Glu-specific endopeptidase
MQMTKPAVCALILAIVGVMATRAASQPAGEDQAVMMVIVANADGFYRRGTAFHVGNGVFYTNVHVVRDQVPEGFTQWYLVGTNATRSRDSWLGPLTVTCMHPMYRGRPESARAFPYDVARLRVAGADNLPALRLSPGFPNVGMRVRTRGFPGASRAWPPVQYTATGRVAEVELTEQIFQVDIESGFALGGSSGSPVIGPDHTVLGIHFASTTQGRTSAETTFAVTVQAVRSGCPLP